MHRMSPGAQSKQLFFEREGVSVGSGADASVSFVTRGATLASAPASTVGVEARSSAETSGGGAAVAGALEAAAGVAMGVGVG
jgi:hypothetical protein